jgi:hypothetical protein
MLTKKPVGIYLDNIYYGGDGIGRDLTFDLSLGGQSFSIAKRIAPGATAPIQRHLLTRQLSRSLSIPVKATVTDDDTVYDDVGSTTGSLRLNPNALGSQKITVDVAGNSWGDGGTKAVFTLVFKSALMTRYIKAPTDGWLTVLINGRRVSLPHMLKVEWHGRESGRDVFTILEGSHKGEKATVKQGNLTADARHRGPAKVTYFSSTGNLRVGNRSYKVTMDPARPLPRDTYDLLIPDHPHGLAEGYSSRFRRVWFPIPGTAYERYLHVGTVSLGCMAINPVERRDVWEEIFNYLIISRKSDTAVGTLEVR